MKQTQIKRGGGANGNQVYRKPACSVAENSQKVQSCSKGFTLAETLITLAIIGIVAALTIPTVVTNYQKNMYVTQLKKNYSNINNAFRTAMARDGVTRLSDTNLWSSLPNAEYNETKYYKTEYAKVREELSKTFNILKVYDGTNGNKINGSGINYTGLNGNDNAFNFGYGTVLSDGAVIWLQLYNRAPAVRKCGYGSAAHDCSSLSEFRAKFGSKNKLWKCIGFMSVDVNGVKGPNKIGRDWFSFYISEEGTLYPEGGVEMATLTNGGDSFQNIFMWWWDGYDDLYRCYMDGISEGDGCAGRIMEEGWKMNY